MYSVVRPIDVWNMDPSDDPYKIFYMSLENLRAYSVRHNVQYVPPFSILENLYAVSATHLYSCDLDGCVDGVLVDPDLDLDPDLETSLDHTNVCLLLCYQADPRLKVPSPRFPHLLSPFVVIRVHMVIVAHVLNLGWM